MAFDAFLCYYIGTFVFSFFLLIYMHWYSGYTTYLQDAMLMFIFSLVPVLNIFVCLIACFGYLKNNRIVFIKARKL